MSAAEAEFDAACDAAWEFIEKHAASHDRWVERILARDHRKATKEASDDIIKAAYAVKNRMETLFKSYHLSAATNGDITRCTNADLMQSSSDATSTIIMHCDDVMAKATAYVAENPDKREAIDAIFAVAKAAKNAAVKTNTQLVNTIISISSRSTLEGELIAFSPGGIGSYRHLYRANEWLRQAKINGDIIALIVINAAFYAASCKAYDVYSLNYETDYDTPDDD